MELNRKNIKKILFIIFVAILMFLSIQNIHYVFEYIWLFLHLISPLLIGLAIAFILNVPLRLIEDRLFGWLNKKNYRLWDRVRRPLSLFLTMAIIAGALFLLVFLFVPELKNTFEMIVQNLPIYMEQMQTWTEKLIHRFNLPADSLKDIQLNWDKAKTTVTDFVQSGHTNFVGKTMDITTSIFSGIFNFIMGIVFALYMLLQKERLSNQAKRVMFAYLPRDRANAMIELGNLTNSIFSKFVTGQFLEGCIIGTLCFVGMSIFSMPYSLIISLLVGFTSLIPVFGAFMGTTIGALLILMVDPMKAVWFVVFIICLQQVEGHFIYPKVVGNFVGLPGIWVLLAVLVGGSTYGVIGMLVSVPICSLLYSLIQQWVEKRLYKKGIVVEENDSVPK
ncbi:AI-2E family transporter [Bacillus testis]|uniref:AI-2E family transporter n=1 Tax=Bacillus testis TaxID=1622072 RepID=UPI00067F3B6E|nr:AI-2E family transporter [Bacillus testis]